MTRIIFIFLLSISTAIADDNNYWAIEIPAVEGATNISNERNKRFYIISTTYEVVVSDVATIYDFYNDFFEKMDWENPMKKFSHSKSEFQGKWNSYRSAFNQDGLPESSYASMWKAKNIPAMGTVNLTLTSFKDGKFNAKIKASLSPEVDTSPLFQLQKLMVEDPRNIFILHEATGGNPFEFDKVSPQPSKEYKNNEMVKDYYKLMEEIFKKFQDFGEKYVQ